MYKLVEIGKLSKIGFGGYRISCSSSENTNALNLAIKSGCNLIDTAPTYTNGQSELLIGNLISKSSCDGFFIITKAGYVTEQVLVDYTKERGPEIPDSFQIDANTRYSIHPDFLNFQIQKSLLRLKRKHIDGYLLHNPEYYFDYVEMNVDNSEFYNRVYKAFEFLEQKVQEGTIRYYGVSSNTLSMPEKRNAVALNKLIEIANKVSSTNHFKIIQFPYNLSESDATKQAHEGLSLIEMANKNGVLTIGNRPFNANDSNNKLLKLSLYDVDPRETSIDDNSAIESCFAMIEKKLHENGRSLSEFKMILALKQQWMTVFSLSAIYTLFYQNLYPFVKVLFNNNVPEVLEVNIKSFEETMLVRSHRSSNKKVMGFLEASGNRHLLNSEFPLDLSLCNQYLKDGLNHILVGMTKSNYVESLKSLFNNNH